MCGFMDNLGWFIMSPSEQWNIVLTMIGGVFVLVFAVVTSRQWYLSKVIEIETNILENTASGRAYFYNLDQRGDVEDTTRTEFQEYLAMYTNTSERIVDNNLSLAELRKLNKLHIAGTKFIQKYTDIRISES
jgi:hypothetical protein